ncbi:hypothetical protein [Candidatus Cryosericum septentrionale]|jgi:hypothetical protein|uniref:Uncharacterized protein n=1 Tax=Candidatus Cryosericum septentrionale TaxID=2290913 RepID=A0A398DYZ5_9BACT|nr:hypothetical protein [Candidatus Cryosericum septentrionale]RIE17398.1 hypothetical protein SMC1_01915 [Candidatus Cryosericum septentrionale]
MKRKHSNQEYADIVLRTLYAKDIGVKVRNIDDLVRLAGSKLDGVDDGTLLNIVGSEEGLLGRGLVDCKSLEGNGTGIVDVRNIDLTRAGREYVAKNLPKTKIGACLGWLTKNILGAAISASVGFIVGLLLGVLFKR